MGVRAFITKQSSPPSLSLNALSLSSWNSSHFDLLCKWSPTGERSAWVESFRVMVKDFSFVFKLCWKDFLLLSSSHKAFSCLLWSNIWLFVCFSDIWHFCLLRYFYSIMWLKCTVSYCTLIKIPITCESCLSLLFKTGLPLFTESSFHTLFLPFLWGALDGGRLCDVTVTKALIRSFPSVLHRWHTHFPLHIPPGLASHRALTSCQTNHYSKGICNSFHVWNPWIFLWTYAFFHHLQCIDYDYMIAHSWPWHYIDCYTIIYIIYLLCKFSFSRSCSDIQNARYCTTKINNNKNSAWDLLFLAMTIKIKAYHLKIQRLYFNFYKLKVSL